MRPIDDQPRYLSVQLAHDSYLLLDAQDAMALVDILARNPIYTKDTENRYDNQKCTFTVNEAESIGMQTIRKKQINFPTPSLADAVQMALIK